jgi:hypothetical protein
MSLNMKLNRLIKQASLNDNVKRNAVHISLNFDPSENLSKEKLMEITNVYMNKIGFGQQPYLVYQHLDAGHPHIHVVSLKIRADGSKIDMNNIGRNQSETARKEIEKSFGLVEAERQQKKLKTELPPISTGKVHYGRSESRKAISNVLREVLPNYKYASLAELNAVLQQYNVLADRGSEDSRTFKKGGLVYRILDEKGKSIGIPMKASDFYDKPTLRNLEEKFTPCPTGQTTNKSRVKNAIDLALLKTNLSITELAKTLEKEGINTVLRKNSEGLIYGITYVDHTTKSVFNGSSLGKQYSAKDVQERCSISSKKEQKEVITPNKKINEMTSQNLSEETLTALFGDNFQDNTYTGANPLFMEIAETLLHVEYTRSYIGEAFKKKKKRRGQSYNP